MKKIIKKIKQNTIKSIEKEILENQEKFKKFKLERENNHDMYDFFNLKMIKIEECNKNLDSKRQHKLDRRNGWISRFIWSILAPIIVAVLTSLLISA